ncbi:LytR/AlgR family response regulator transcription factor [Aureispira anguillae]|uniref:LytTR family DNA-binding domain-containing protein n=1 Tax=Aureispira anguillae TaxID=2864201 RepID=A0A916DX51_9BACT|nr:LytTR family DNA-binding domain-containing protein [Aureispira anguillae]BDS15400.1 LytTR family DNA-binding domain-containing protein [Aureispira anguillae]
MRALVIDDESRARETICQIIKLYTPEINVIAEIDNVQDGITAIQQYQPDLIFLDIQLGDGNGFDILKAVDNTNLNVIFITAYDEYVLKALKVSAIDYILKPIDPDEFILAVEKAQKKISQEHIKERLNFFIQNMELPNKSIQKITLKTADSIHIVKIEDIIYCQADRNYTTFYFVNGQEIIVSKNLREYEALLPSKNFIRPHHSYLVNLNHIVRYDKSDRNALISINDHKIPVSTRRKDQIIQFLKNIG